LNKRQTVVPAKAGTHAFQKRKLDPRLRGGDVHIFSAVALKC
jgi:hypothetical protein